MNGVIQANDNALDNILQRLLPKKTRLTSSQATAKVRKSVKGKTKSISQEQGFRNYLKYTDPMLQVSDETTDASKINNDLEQILSVFDKSDNVYDMQKDIVNDSEIKTEIIPEKIPINRDKWLNSIENDIKEKGSVILKERKKQKAINDRKEAAEILKNLGKKRENAANTIKNYAISKLDANYLQPQIVEILEKRKAITKIQNAVRNKNAKKELFKLSLDDAIRKDPDVKRERLGNAAENRLINAKIKKQDAAKTLQAVIKRQNEKENFNNKKELNMLLNLDNAYKKSAAETLQAVIKRTKPNTKYSLAKRKKDGDLKNTFFNSRPKK
jgi:hypothetical protein